MSIQFDQEFFSSFKDRSAKKFTPRASLVSTSESVNHSFLLSKLTFNLSKGHYYFVYEILKTKIEKLQYMGIEANPNEQANMNESWLQAEKDNLSKKFLHGKTCLIICTFIKELEWSTTLARLLIDRGAQLTTRDLSNGCYPIHYACALLKPELIELFIRRSDFDLEMLDHNHNTPLVYFMVAFSFYLNKLWSPITNARNTKKAINKKKLFERKQKDFNEEEYSDDEIIKENVDEDFELKIMNALKVYLGHVKRFKLKVNSVNRFGYSLLDIKSYIIASNKNLENHLFFILIKNASIDSENYTDSKINSALSRLSINDQDKAVKQISYKSSSYKSGSLIDSILDEAPSATIKIYLELILKKNLLINLNEIQFPRIITHEKIVDKDLVFLFLEKQINDGRAITIFNNEAIPPQIEKKEKTFKDDWREKLTTCYHYLEIDQSKSLRKGATKTESVDNIISMLNVLSKKTQLPQINETMGASRMGRNKK